MTEISMYLAAFGIGVFVGLLLSVPLGPTIRHRVRVHDVTYLQAELHKAIAELEKGHPRLSATTSADHGPGYGVQNGLT